MASEKPAFESPPTSEDMKQALQEFSSAVYDAYVAMEEENQRLRETKADVFIQTVSGDEAVGKPVKVSELEQQLAQAREENKDVHNELYLAIAHIRKLEQENAQARVLLDRATNDDSPILAVLPETAASIAALALLQEMRNFLEQREQENG